MQLANIVIIMKISKGLKITIKVNNYKTKSFYINQVTSQKFSK